MQLGCCLNAKYRSLENAIHHRQREYFSVTSLLYYRNENNRKAHKTVQICTLHREDSLLNLRGVGRVLSPREFRWIEGRYDEIYDVIKRGSAKIERTISETIKTDARSNNGVRLMSYHIDRIETGLLASPVVSYISSEITASYAARALDRKCQESLCSVNAQILFIFLLQLVEEFRCNDVSFSEVPIEIRRPPEHRISFFPTSFRVWNISIPCTFIPKKSERIWWVKSEI